MSQAFVVGIGVLAAGLVQAHDTWLLARPSSPANSGVVLLDLTSGMSFPDLDHAIAADRVSRARVRVRAQTSEIRIVTARPDSLVLSAPFDGSALATIWVELAPKSIDLTPKQVAEYLDEIDAPSAIRHEWANRQPGAQWHEVYVKHAKTFLGATEADDRSFAIPAGMSLELVPETDPTRLRPGDEIVVRLLKDGAAASGLAVGAVREGDVHGVTTKTDDAGVVRIRLDRAGRWMLRATEIRMSGDPDKTWRSHFTTLTLDVRDEPAGPRR